MFSLKKISSLILLSVLSVSFAHAKSHKEGHEKQMKHKQGKELPRGLQKKLNRGGELPPGWQKKLVVGQRLDPVLLEGAIVVDRYKYYNKDIEKPTTKEKIYQIEDKIVKVMAATNIILDVFEVE